MKGARGLLLAGVMLTAIGCGGFSPEDFINDLVGNAVGDACSGDFEITVGTGLNPSISWEGAAAGLAVAEFPDASTRMWTLAQVGSDGFSGPVTYGTTPASALVAEGPADLVAGTEYSVTITLANGNQASCALFTP